MIYSGFHWDEVQRQTWKPWLSSICRWRCMTLP